MIDPMRIDIFSDTVCPWCYLGKRRFALALSKRPHIDVRATWRPFELHPDLPAEGVDRAWFLATRVGDQERFAESQKALIALGAAIGIGFRFDLIERMPNTRLSHLLIALAGRANRQAEVKERIMRAYFEEGRDIGDVDELVRLGVEAGLSEYEARCTLVLRTGNDAVVAAERHAATLGITGVPTFIFNGRYMVSGAQEAETLTRIFDQVSDLSTARETKP